MWGLYHECVQLHELLFPPLFKYPYLQHQLIINKRPVHTLYKGSDCCCRPIPFRLIRDPVLCLYQRFSRSLEQNREQPEQRVHGSFIFVVLTVVLKEKRGFSLMGKGRSCWVKSIVRWRKGFFLSPHEMKEEIEIMHFEHTLRFWGTNRAAEPLLTK